MYMYREQLKTLYLNKSRLIFKDAYGLLLDREIEVQEYCTSTDFPEETQPDYYCRGFFRKIDKGFKHEFIISELGPDVLYISAFPKEEKDIAPYRVPNAAYTSYWQDNSKAYLFQVVKDLRII